MLSNLKTRLKLFIGHAVAQSVTQSVTQSIANSHRICVYMGNERALTRTIYGHKMYVKTNDLSLAPHVLLDGFWESWITKVFVREISEGMVALDIGANIGYYSLLAAAAVGPKGRLHCFEANPDVYEILYQNIEINGFLSRAEIVNKAVFWESKELEFSVCEKHQGSSSIFLDERAVEIYQDNLKRIKVQATSLDDHFPKGSKVDFIKIDAEGAEPDIIKGAARLLGENADIKIIMEWSTELLDRRGVVLRDFWGLLQSYGFKAYRIAHDSSLILEGFEKLSQAEHCDIFLKRGG